MSLSLRRVSSGELECPRLFVLLPQEDTRGSNPLLRLRPQKFLKDKYRLTFLDPVSGYATRCGPDGKGYALELPKKWIVDNRKYIDYGLKLVKISAASGRLLGLPIASAADLPSSIVSQAELQAVSNFERLVSSSSELSDSSIKRAAPSKAATGQAYKHLRKMLKDQCNDEYLLHCSMTKQVRARAPLAVPCV